MTRRVNLLKKQDNLPRMLMIELRPNYAGEGGETKQEELTYIKFNSETI